MKSIIFLQVEFLKQDEFLKQEALDALCLPLSSLVSYEFLQLEFFQCLKNLSTGHPG